MGYIREEKSKKRMIKRLKELCEEIGSAVRTSKGLAREFGRKINVREGCVLSPVLYV